MAKSGHLGPAVVQKEEAKALRIKRRELYRRWKCGYWKNYLPIVQLPIWLVMVETLRGMCGATKGLLGMIFTREAVKPLVDGASPSASASITPIAADRPTADINVEHSLASTPINSSIGTLTEPYVTADLTTSTPLSSVYFEPSLATEGILWFPDLTVPDQLLILPFALSATMLLNIYSTSRRNIVGADVIATESPFQRRLSRALGILALAIGPLTLQMQSAILLYWVSSSLLAYGQGRMLDRFMPLKPSMKPCKPKVMTLRP